MQLSITLTTSASEEIKRLFDEANNTDYHIKVLASKQEEVLVFELEAIEPEEHNPETDLLFQVGDIKVSVQKNQANIFNGVQLDYKKPADSPEPVFIFSRITK